jgi:hypothetical protein
LSMGYEDAGIAVYSGIRAFPFAPSGRMLRVELSLRVSAWCVSGVGRALSKVQISSETAAFSLSLWRLPPCRQIQQTRRREAEEVEGKADNGREGGEGRRTEARRERVRVQCRVADGDGISGLHSNPAARKQDRTDLNQFPPSLLPALNVFLLYSVLFSVLCFTGALLSLSLRRRICRR